MAVYAPIERLEADGRLIPWGGPIRRIDMNVAHTSDYLTRNPATGRLEPLQSRRLHIYHNDTEVTWRCRVADTRTDMVALMLPADGVLEKRPGCRAWLLNEERTAVQTIMLHGRVRIEYDWPEVA